MKRCSPPASHNPFRRDRSARRPATGTRSGPPTAGEPPEADIPTIAFEKYTLPNGLEVILVGRPPAAAGGGEPLVPRRPGQRGAGADRLRAPLRAHDVPGLEARRRATRTSRLLEGAGGSDVNGTTDFDRTNYFETVPANQLELGALARVRPHGVPARRGRSGEAVQPAGRGPQRAPAERREPARTGSCEEALFQQLFPPGHPYYAQRHRLARRHPGREARRREGLLQALLRAQQRQPGDRRRHRRRRRSAMVEKYFGTLEARAAGAEARRADAADHAPSGARGARTGSSCRASTWPG